MRRIVATVLTFVMMVSFAGCSVQKPETVVNDYCKALKTFDLEKAVSCLKSETEAVEGLDEFKQEIEEKGEKYYPILQYFKDNNAKMTYTIGEIQQDGEDKATVNVTFNHVDAENVITSVVSDYVMQALVMAIGGADENKLEDLLISVFKEKIKIVEPGTSVTDIKFNCEKVDGQWKISNFSEEDGEKMLNVVTLNMTKALKMNFKD